MNEHLQDLARRAGFIGTNFSNTVIGTDQETALANFAELIIKECVLISRTSSNGFSASRRMGEHFGVEQ